jgi:hypothetical protein
MIFCFAKEEEEEEGGKFMLQRELMFEKTTY